MIITLTDILTAAKSKYHNLSSIANPHFLYIFLHIKLKLVYFEISQQYSQLLNVKIPLSYQVRIQIGSQYLA